MVDFPTYQALAQLYADYAATLDAGDWTQWPEFFVDDCIYRIVPRENYDNGLPLATLAFESKAMLQDRVYAISETIFHDPYYQRHVVAAPRVLAADAGQLECEASYAVFRTKPSQPTTVFNVGRYIDVVRHTPQGLKFASRQCVFDSELIPNSMIYPL